jgi:hypothetical protein
MSGLLSKSSFARFAATARVLFGAAIGATVSITPQIAAASCVVSGKAVTLSGVRVRPRGAPAFSIDLHEVSVTAKPSASNAPATLDVTCAIRFRAQHRMASYTVARAIDTKGGLLHLDPGARIVDARLLKDALVGSIVIASRDTPEGVDLQPEVVATPVNLACDSLTLDSIAIDHPSTHAGDQSWWVPRWHARAVRLAADPEPAARTLLVRAVTPGAERLLAFERLEQRGQWMRIAYASDGVVARGWVRSSGWYSAPDAGGTATTPGEEQTAARVTHFAGAARYEGPARIAIGTAIYAEPQRGKWATVQQRDGFLVRDDGSNWIALTRIPGISGAEGAAYVPRAAVEFPYTG